MAKKAVKPVNKRTRKAKVRVLTKPQAVIEMARLARKVIKAEEELTGLVRDLGFTGKHIDEQVARCLGAVRTSDAVKAKNKTANRPAEKVPKKKSARSVKKTPRRRRA
jgi:hypothetical protein